MIIITGAPREIQKTVELERFEEIEEGLILFFNEIKDAAIVAFKNTLENMIELFEIVKENEFREEIKFNVAPKMQFTRIKFHNQVTDRKPRHINRKIIQ